MMKRLSLVQNKSVFTKDTEAPSIPLFVKCHHITSSCIHLNWAPPIYDGGVPIMDYIIHYTILLKTINVSATIINEQHMQYHAKHTSPSPIGEMFYPTTIIRNLPPETDIINIYVCAVNEEGFISDKGKLKIDGRLHSLLLLPFFMIIDVTSLHYCYCCLTIFMMIADTATTVV